MVMGYGALSLWMLIKPEMFGYKAIPEKELLGAADRASRALRTMFHAEPLKPWAARKKGRRVASVYRVQQGEMAGVEFLL